MKVHGYTKHWRFSAGRNPSPNWCFGGYIIPDGVFFYFGRFSVGLWRQQRAIP